MYIYNTVYHFQVLYYSRYKARKGGVRYKDLIFMSLAHQKFVISSCILGHQFTVLVWKHSHTDKQPNSYQNSMFKE